MVSEALSPHQVRRELVDIGWKIKGVKIAGLAQLNGQRVFRFHYNDDYNYGPGTITKELREGVKHLGLKSSLPAKLSGERIFDGYTHEFVVYLGEPA